MSDDVEKSHTRIIPKNTDSVKISEEEKEAARADTLKHREQVSKFLKMVADELRDRARTHDESKLHEPELSQFAIWGPKLKELDYGTAEYKDALAHMKGTVQHHYENNRHHPEHFEDGLQGMNLVDLVEMVCDWKAASMRMKSGGDFMKSLEFNKKRFSLETTLFSILYNTDEILK